MSFRRFAWALALGAFSRLCLADDAVQRWQDLARADLEAVHLAIVDGHPGMLDELNPGFKAWTDKGYQEALALLSRVTNRDAALSLVNDYVTTFRDGHLVYLRESAALPQAAARTNSFEFRNGLLWIRAANFGLTTDDAASLQTMLRQLAGLRGVKQIVFDLRGNGGGDSSVGDRIFDAATGGLDFDLAGLDKLPRIHAQWRVSPIALDAARRRLDRRIEVYGPDSDNARNSRAFLAAIELAHSRGRTWFDQDGGYRITRQDVVSRHGRLRRFTGPVVLVTDGGCVSACLDMADKVRLVPGAVHIGRTTGADSVYIDVAWIALPSGNQLMLPLKVWRNRVRGNNEPLVPDIPIDGDIDDDAAVHRAALAAMPAARRH
ncbi:S41 family peptidase [Piscinibacter terrae]|uniref:Uncharacterized protein n=1 Tax=Piscinibacter terrae TaxID=2496871 RepID=A0A3N7HWK5_9BURK|nr:S41 family peptidase [Albitalea terrae]RQP25796.1 hypothetical protein DZC73_01640 [Albitalea terrae]